MSEEYSLPDVTTPFISPDHERACFDSPRYKNEPSYRDAVAKKAALTIAAPNVLAQHGGGSKVQIGEGDDGRHVRATHSVRIQFSEADVAEERLRQDLTRQLEETKAALERGKIVQAEAAVDYMAQPNFWPSSPENQELAKTPFKNNEEMIAAMRSAPYRNDPKARAHVESRLQAGFAIGRGL